jgi:hypothetical protein
MAVSWNRTIAQGLILIFSLLVALDLLIVLTYFTKKRVANNKPQFEGETIPTERVMPCPSNLRENTSNHRKMEQFMEKTKELVKHNFQVI